MSNRIALTTTYEYKNKILTGSEMRIFFIFQPIWHVTIVVLLGRR